MDETERLIIVNSDDVPIDYKGKMVTHKEGLLHRAFSIFIFDCKRNKVLIQKRAQCKYHSGGLWSNSCCSHMLFEKTEIEVIEESLKRELGIENVFLKTIKLGENLEFCGKFIYSSNYGMISENEIDSVYLLHMDSNQFIKMNKDEVDDYQWIDIDELIRWNNEHSTDFTAWFDQALKLVLMKLEER